MKSLKKEKDEKTAPGAELCFERKALGKSAHFSLAKISEGAKLTAVLNGSLTVVIDGEEMTLCAGELAFMPPRSIYCYRAEEEETEVISLLVCDALLSRVGIFSNGRYPAPFPKERKNAQNALKILVTLLEIYDKSDETDNSLYIAATALGALAAVRPPETLQSNPSRCAVAGALSFIDENIENPISLDSLSRELGYTKNHLSFIFNKFTKTNLREQLNRKRLALISRLKHELGDLPFYRIVMRAGFDSQNTYYRALARYGDSN